MYSLVASLMSLGCVLFGKMDADTPNIYTIDDLDPLAFAL